MCFPSANRKASKGGASAVRCVTREHVCALRAPAPPRSIPTAATMMVGWILPPRGGHGALPAVRQGLYPGFSFDFPQRVTLWLVCATPLAGQCTSDTTPEAVFVLTPVSRLQAGGTVATSAKLETCGNETPPAFPSASNIPPIASPSIARIRRRPRSNSGFVVHVGHVGTCP